MQHARTANKLAVLALSAAILSAAALGVRPQPVQAAPRVTVTMVVIDGKGERAPAIDVTDVSVGLSRGTYPDKPEEVQDQLSAQLDTGVLTNPAMLAWMSNGSPGSSVEVTVKSGTQTVVYLLSDITSSNLSASHSSGGGGMDGQVSLSLGAKHLTINGVRVN